MHTTYVLYLHGFRSSPRSFKAQRMAGVVRERHPGVHWWCPQLPASPAQAMREVMERTATWPADRMAVDDQWRACVKPDAALTQNQ